MLILHQDKRSLELLGPGKQVTMLLCWKQHIRKLVRLNNQRYFNVIMGEFKSDATSYLKKAMMTFEEQQQNTKTHTVFVEATKIGLAKELFKPLDAQELQEPETVSAILG